MYSSIERYFWQLECFYLLASGFNQNQLHMSLQHCSKESGPTLCEGLKATFSRKVSFPEKQTRKITILNDKTQNGFHLETKGKKWEKTVNTNPQHPHSRAAELGTHFPHSKPPWPEPPCAQSLVRSQDSNLIRPTGSLTPLSSAKTLFPPASKPFPSLRMPSCLQGSAFMREAAGEGEKEAVFSSTTQLLFF